LKSKYNLNQLIKYARKEIKEEPTIGEITEIRFNDLGITYIVCGYAVFENEVIASFSQDVVVVKKTRVRKNKTAVIAIDSKDIDTELK